jgi:hypothetical protein
MNALTTRARSAVENQKRSRRARRVLLPLLASVVAVAGGFGLLQTVAPTAAAATTTSDTRMLASLHPAHKVVTRAAVHIQKPDWSIGITAIGLQAEVDACQWVRMDFSSAVTIPVVAAHNFCGGGIVLEMQLGQTVAVSGAGLDGDYVVVATKDAWADQDAADAISGLSADVIVQTCYWENDGHLLLVALQRKG